MDFAGADLRSASFRDTKLGVPPRIGLALLGAAMILAIGAGLAIGWAVSNTRDRFSADQWDDVAEGGTIAVVVLVLLGVIIWRGVDVAIKVIIVLYLVLLVVNMVANLIWDEVEWAVVARATAVVVFVLLAVLTGILGRVVGGVFGGWSVAVVAVLGGLATGRADGGLAGVVVAVTLVLISKRTLRGVPRDRTVRRLAHRIVRRPGTRFVDADLTGADFTGTDASQRDARGATVTGVTWDPDHALPVDMPSAS